MKDSAAVVANNHRMASPTFNSQKIFDSIATDGTTYYSEGVLYVPSYSPILQRIHFEGEVGDWTLFHGYPDMEWIFDGVISAPSLTSFNTQIGNIQSAIDACTSGDNMTYYTLKDSFGNVYSEAQVRTLTFTSPPQIWIWNNGGSLATGYLAHVRATGVVSTNSHIGAT